MSIAPRYSTFKLRELKVSVVIPTKDRPSEVERLLSELLRQTLIPDEVIVVDDSSNQQTKYVVEKLKPIYSQKRVKLRYIRNANSSSRARTLGGFVAQGDIIIYVDDDLHLESFALRCLISSLVKTNAIAVWGKVSFPDMKYAEGGMLVGLLDRSIRNLIFGSITYGGGLFAVYRKVLNEGVLFDWNMSGYALFEDQDFSCNLIKRYGLESVIMLRSPVLAVNTSALLKSREFFINLFGNSFYLCFKWKGVFGLITFTYVSLIICLFYIMSRGGIRGKALINSLEILKSYLYTIRRLPKIISGNWA